MWQSLCRDINVIQTWCIFRCEKKQYVVKELAISLNDSCITIAALYYFLIICPELEPSLKILTKMDIMTDLDFREIRYKTLRTASKGKGKLHNPGCSISVTVRLIDGFRINFLVSVLVDRYLTWHKLHKYSIRIYYMLLIDLQVSWKFTAESIPRKLTHIELCPIFSLIKYPSLFTISSFRNKYDNVCYQFICFE